jgi:MFS family permease
LLDQRTGFGRLARVHVLMTAGDTLLTVSLAGSLFFSISPQAAKGKVVLYLLLTMAPFAVVAPLLGPLIDRSRGARRATVVLSALGRAVTCALMAGALKSLLLFPEAFTMLVLSKVYLVTKGALVPQYAYGTGSEAPAPASVVPTSASAEPDRLAVANAHLGLLASLAGLAAALPAVAVLKLLGGSWVLRLDVVVFAVAVVAALRLPRPAPEPQPVPEHPGAHGPGRQATTGPLALLAGPGVHPEVTLALSAMSVLRGLVGFLTFLLAFSLRRMHAATWWYGFVLAASVAGALVGVLLVPRLRRLLTEPQMLAGSIWLVALCGAAAGAIGGLLTQAALAFVVGLSAAAAKPAFDALVQRYVPTVAQGHAFARFETRLQLVWVVGALLPVVSAMPMGAGDVVIAAVAGVSGLSYLTGRRAVRQRLASAR